MVLVIGYDSKFIDEIGNRVFFFSSYEDYLKETRVKKLFGFIKEDSKNYSLQRIQLELKSNLNFHQNQ